MLRIKKEIYDSMIQHCIDSLPYEACGILAGKELVTSIYFIKNMAASSVSYFMEPYEQLKAIKDIRERGNDMLAIFHSHPYGSAYPSGKDMELSFYDVYYVIVALKPEIEIRCFKIKENIVSEVQLIKE